MNAVDENGMTALHHAARSGCTDSVGVLSDSKADVNASDKYRQTALMYAAVNGHTETVQALLNAGADMNKQDKYGNTALDLLFMRRQGIDGMNLAKITKLLEETNPPQQPYHMERPKTAPPP